MAHPRNAVSDSSLALALLLGLGLAAAPTSTFAAPDDDDDDLVLEDDDDEGYDDDLDGEDDDENLGDDDEPEEENPFDDDGGSSASASGSVSLGGADGKAKRTKKKRKPREKKPKVKDERPFFERYKPTNHMLNVGGYIGVFWRGNNHGLFDRGIGPQPQVDRSNLSLGFRLEYMPIPYVGLGFETGGMPTSSPSEGNARAGFYTARVHVVGSLPYRLAPTLAVGGGGIGLRSRNSDILNGSDGAFHWGPGAKFYINDWVAVRVDGRHIITGNGIDNRRVHHGELLFGAEVNLRLTKWVGADYRAKRTDSDGDTIADYYDECPDEPGGDDNGCPLNRDSDNDGVADRRDKCPNEWGDSANGCPVPDMDGDGILDLDDECEEQAENYNGFDDTDGCPDELPEEITQFEGVVEGIYFDSGRSSIRRASRPTLNEVADVMKKYPSVKVSVTGHTDSKGDHDSNVSLSQARADAVRDYLVDKGIEESRITTDGRGPDEPIADNKTKKGRSKNRRIEFKILQ